MSQQQQAQTCPVCQGRQRVPFGFYEPTSNGTFTAGDGGVHTEPCRTCKETGIVWELEGEAFRSLEGSDLALLLSTKEHTTATIRYDFEFCYDLAY